MGSPRTVRVLHDLIGEYKPDFLFLMETILVKSTIDKLAVSLGFASNFSVDRVGRSGGLAVFWRGNVDCSIQSFSRNHIEVIFNERNIAVWRLSCFYGYPERDMRRSSWDLI